MGVSAEQVEERMLSVNLSEWCSPQVKAEKCNGTTLSWSARHGSQCQSNLQPENTVLRKPWIWLCQITDALSHPAEKPCMSKQEVVKTADFPHMCFWHFTIYIQMFGTKTRPRGNHRHLWDTKFLLNNTTADAHLQSTSRQVCYTSVPFSVILFDKHKVQQPSFIKLFREANNALQYVYIRAQHRKHHINLYIQCIKMSSLCSQASCDILTALCWLTIIHTTATCVWSYHEKCCILFFLHEVSEWSWPQKRGWDQFIHMLCSKIMKIPQNCVKASALFTADKVWAGQGNILINIKTVLLWLSDTPPTVPLL